MFEDIYKSIASVFNAHEKAEIEPVLNESQRQLYRSYTKYLNDWLSSNTRKERKGLMVSSVYCDYFINSRS